MMAVVSSGTSPPYPRRNRGTLSPARAHAVSLSFRRSARHESRSRVVALAHLLGRRDGEGERGEPGASNEGALVDVIRVRTRDDARARAGRATPGADARTGALTSVLACVMRAWRASVSV